MEADIVDTYDHVNEHIFYTPICIPGKDCDLSTFESQILTRCNCPNTCNESQCSCLTERGRNYENGKLVPVKLLNGHVTECNSYCSCGPDCGNRVVQRGPRLNLEVRNFGAKGCGLVSTVDVDAGDFICEYAGEVISPEEAVRRRKSDTGNANYIFTLNEYTNNHVLRTVVDATCIANVARYINHSCDPNCVVVPIRVDSVVPRLAIFALQHIDAGVEIAYSYCGIGDDGSEEHAEGRTLCLCGFDRCRKYLPFQCCGTEEGI